jgi:hypothetical protein
VSETKDVLASHADIAERLAKLMQSSITNGRTTLGLPQNNQHDIQLERPAKKKSAGRQPRANSPS